MINNQKIKFGDKDYYVVDFFEYKSQKYFYIVEDTYQEGININEPKGNVEINFIYKCDDGKYENVVDDKLFQELLTEAGKRMLFKK